MAEQRKGRSGKILFALLTLGVLSAIAATVLVANDFRNLNRLIGRFGHDPIASRAIAPEQHPRAARTDRLPQRKIEVPEHLIARIAPVETTFVRPMASAPEQLCRALESRGFVNDGWQQSAAHDGWECASYREFQVGGSTEDPNSSLYLSIRGSDQARLDSFRIKLNLENDGSRADVTGAAIAAVETFLAEMQWDEKAELLDDIRTLKEFDIAQLGSRIRLKKESGETPRYNFIITPDRTRPNNTSLPDYFDRRRWLPMPDPPMASRRDL